MDGLLLLGSGLFTWVVLPVLIFVARILDVSLGTVRLIFVSRGFKYLAPVVGFFEVLIWILAMGQPPNVSVGGLPILCPLIKTFRGYAGGFAMGNFVGICIAEKLSLGVVLVRVVTDKDASGLIESPRMFLSGVIFTIVPRKEVRSVVNLVKKFDLQAFYSVEEVGFVEKGVSSFSRGQVYPCESRGEKKLAG